jgi:hypothetical protein
MEKQSVIAPLISVKLLYMPPRENNGVFLRLIECLIFLPASFFHSKKASTGIMHLFV